MKRVHRHLSYASWRLLTFRRLFLPSTDSIRPTRAPRREISSTARNQTPPGSAAQESSASRDDGIEATGPNPERPSSRLPQSPLLTHPRLVDPEKYKTRKRRPSAADTDDLRKNPWAMALTSPVRMCAATKVRVPAEFMSHWGFIRPKDTEELWFSPLGLMSYELNSVARSKQAAGGAEEDQAQTRMQAMQQKETGRPLMLRIIDRIPLLRLLNGFLVKGEFQRSRSPVVRLFPPKWRYPHGAITAKEEKRVIWKDDMPDFVLRRIRAMAMRKLTRAARLHRHIDASNGVWTAVEIGVSSDAEGDLVEGLKRLKPFERMGTGGVLVIGSEARNPASYQQSPPSSSQSVFPEYVTLPQTQSKVPVFDLSMLFSNAEQEELRSSYPHFQGTAVFFRPDDTVTVQTMLGLWKLKSSLRELP